MGPTTNGFIAGVIGGIIMNAINLAAYFILNTTNIRFLDWASIIILGSMPSNSAEFFYALFIQLMFSGVMGVIFNYLMIYVLSREYIINAILYSFFVSLISRGYVLAYKVPFLYTPSLTTSITNISSIFLWGLVLGFLLKRLNYNENLREGMGDQSEAYEKPGLVPDKSKFRIRFPERNKI